MGTPRKILRYPDLKPEKGIDYTPVHLNRMEDAGTFPPKVRFSANKSGWYEDQIDLWLATRPSSFEPIPVLWPVRGRPPKGRGSPGGAAAPGRPRGSRVIRGRLVLAEDVPAALAAMRDG
jgi:prophage regulatory protein